MIGAKGVNTFPIKGDNTFSLSNAPGSPIYDGPEAKAAEQKRTDDAAEAIIKKFEEEYNKKS